MATEGYGEWGELIPCKWWDAKKDYCIKKGIYDPPCVCNQYEKKQVMSRNRSR